MAVVWSGFVGLGAVAAGVFVELTGAGYARRPWGFAAPVAGVALGASSAQFPVVSGSSWTFDTLGFFPALSGGSPVLVYPLLAAVTTAAGVAYVLPAAAVGVDTVNDRTVDGGFLDSGQVGAVVGLVSRAGITPSGATASRTIPDILGERLNVLNFAALGVLIDRSGGADASAAFQAAYAAATAGQAIIVPPGKYRVNTPPAGAKTVAWMICGAMDPAGGDLTALQATGHLVALTNQSGNVTLAQRGTTLGLMDIFGGDGIALGVVSLGNAIVGYSDNSAVGSTAFGTGVTGVGRLAAAGGQVFGVYGQVNMYTAGVATNELDIFNYAGPPSTQLPPNRGFGTAENNAITLTIGGGSGTYPSSIGTHYAYSGTSMVTGIYMGADAVTGNGLFIDATAAQGPSNPLIVKGKAGVVIAQITATGTYTPASAVMTWSAGAGVRATVYQDGTFQNAAARIGVDGNITLAGNVSVTGTVSVSGSIIGASVGAKSVAVSNPATGIYALQTWAAPGNGTSVLQYSEGTWTNGPVRLDGTGYGTFTGSLTTPLLQFPATTAAKINMYGTGFGFGVSSGEVTLYSGGAWAFRAGGYAGSIVYSIGNDGSSTQAKGAGMWGHAAPPTQPARCVTLADVIAVLAGCGATA